MQPRINIITLGTHNLAKATHFYENVLGLPKMDFEGHISFFSLNSTWLALYPWDHLAQDAQTGPKGDGFRGITLAHNVASPDEVTALLDVACKGGARLVKEGQKTDWGGFSGYFADLDGHLWEVAHNPFFWPGPKDAPDEKSR